MCAPNNVQYSAPLFKDCNQEASDRLIPWIHRQAFRHVQRKRHNAVALRKAYRERFHCLQTGCKHTDIRNLATHPLDSRVQAKVKMRKTFYEQRTSQNWESLYRLTILEGREPSGCWVTNVVYQEKVIESHGIHQPASEAEIEDTCVVEALDN